MGTKTVRLEEDVYERIKAHKRDDETFSEAIDRLIGGYSLLNLAEMYDAEDADRHQELLERGEDVDERKTREMLNRVDE